MSNALGVGTLPVYVVIDEKRQPGLYITTPPAGLGRKMGLAKGSVLLSIDGYAMTTTQVADDWLKRRPATPMKYTYAVLKGDTPKIYSRELTFPQEKSRVSSVPAMNTKEAPQLSSMNELENYGLSLINASRRAEGKAPVQADSALSKLARNYADYMLQHGDQYGFPLRRNPHLDLEGRVPMQRARDAGIMTEVHENLGMETRGSRTDSALLLKQHNMMMDEPPGQHNHRAIILDDEARLVGIGISRDQTHFFLVEEFGH